MIRILKIVFSFFFVLSIVDDVCCIKCFSCRSDFDPKCGDPFDNSTVPISDCNREKVSENVPSYVPTLCRKIMQEVGGKLVISRGCAWEGGDNYMNACPLSSTNANEATVYCQTCDERDGCNGAFATTITLSLIVAPLAVLLFN